MVPLYFIQFCIHFFIFIFDKTTHSECVRNFVEVFQKELNATLATVNLVDITLSSTTGGFLGQSLMSLGMMLRMYTTHRNVLRKYDL